MPINIEYWSPDRLKPYEKNPRINEPAVDAVIASIRAYGFRQPIVVDRDGVILAGHTRWKAALKMGLGEVPVHVADLTPEQARAYRIADNKTSDLSDWDPELLVGELAALRDLDVDLVALGFNDDELRKLLGEDAKDGLTDPDSVPEPPDDPVTKRGDLWVLGDHRLLCGDSAEPADLDRLLAGAPIHLVNTDPPYNVCVEPRSHNAIAAGNSSFQSFQAAPAGHAEPGKMRARDRALKNDFVTDAEFDMMLRAWFGNLARVLLPGRAFYIWGGYSNVSNYPAAIKESGLYFSQIVVWVKHHPVLTRKDFMGNHESSFYGWREGAAHVFLGPANIADVWEVKKISPGQMVHLTEKPVELAVRAIQYSSRPGEHVLDLFGGSGSTLIGCEQTSRRAFLMEIDEAYCDVIVKRWEDYTGRKATKA